MGLQISVPLWTGGYRNAKQEEAVLLADKAAAEADLTLSGRTELWGWLLPRVGERPIGGWGWLSVWEEPDLRQQIVERFDVPFATAHNGLLEVALGAGIPAMVVVAVAIGALVWQPFSWLAATRPGPERRRASAGATGPRPRPG